MKRIASRIALLVMLQFSSVRYFLLLPNVEVLILKVADTNKANYRDQIPHIVVGGFAKCATTTLFRWLTSHPYILKPWVGVNHLLSIAATHKCIGFGYLGVFFYQMYSLIFQYMYVPISQMPSSTILQYCTKKLTNMDADQRAKL